MSATAQSVNGRPSESPIMAHEATLRTATVQIKALTVSGKQVTLSVFRQIIAEHIVATDDDDMPILAGQPWGTVRYCWSECRGLPKHIHVVWQKGSELRRSLVFASGIHDPWWEEKQESSQIGVERLVMAHYLNDQPYPEGIDVQLVNSAPPALLLTGRGLRILRWNADPILAARIRGGKPAHDRFVREIGASRYASSVEDVLAELEDWHRWSFSFLMRYSDLYAQARELDHLFIAL